MNGLLKINYETEQPTVSARELHEGLGINTKFTTWFERMCEYGFNKNADYEIWLSQIWEAKTAVVRTWWTIKFPSTWQNRSA